MDVPRKRPCSRRGRNCGRGALFLFGLSLFFLIILFPHGVSANWQPLTERLVADGFDGQAIRALFSRPEVRFEPKIMASKISGLVRNQTAGRHVDGPLDHNDVYRGYMNDRVISRARAYMKDNRALLEEARTSYGVPGEVVVSILLVETRLGRSTGGAIVFNRLASMALCTDLDAVRPYLTCPVTSTNEDIARSWCRKKSDWAYNELKALLTYAGQSGIDPLGIKGSPYGAIGLCQFMPSNIFFYGVDADNDGRIDPFVTPDAIHSIANYLRQHGWSSALNRKGRRKVIFEYNNSTVYVNTILAIADKLTSRNYSKQ